MADWKRGGLRVGRLDDCALPCTRTTIGITGAFNIHWLNGPVDVALESRVFDFAQGVRFRDQLSDRFSYDLFASLWISSDFEGSAREGVRFPAHAVGIFHVVPCLDVVAGIDYLDRGPESVLPVFGVSMRHLQIGDVSLDRLRLDLIFPRPRIEYVLNSDYALYFSGRTDGGLWAVEFPDSSEHVVAYRDYRLAIGVSHADDDGSVSGLELGWVFDRVLHVRSQGERGYPDTFMIRWISEM